MGKEPVSGINIKLFSVLQPDRILCLCLDHTISSLSLKQSLWESLVARFIKQLQYVTSRFAQ